MAQGVDYRNPRSAKYYSSLGGGPISDGYNPQVTTYYNVSGEAVRIAHLWRGVTYTQTISGTTASGTFDTSVSYYRIESPWEIS